MARTNKPSKTVSESSSSQQVSQPDVVVAPVSAETSAPSEPKVKKAKKTKAEKEVAPVVKVEAKEIKATPVINEKKVVKSTKSKKVSTK